VSYKPLFTSENNPVRLTSLKMTEWIGEWVSKWEDKRLCGYSVTTGSKYVHIFWNTIMHDKIYKSWCY
jgi:hypothetical protein